MHKVKTTHMKKIILSYCLLFIFASNYAQAPDWLWAKNSGGIKPDYNYDLSSDAFGNTYMIGSYSSPIINFGTTILNNIDTNTSPYAGSSDAFLVKYDYNGNAT